ncbi:MAG: hypothetical protein GY859_40435 [Desulfobacterales bacterium]|nr:hypothetical protein [Desulfobacterales bacterium]
MGLFFKKIISALFLILFSWCGTCPAGPRVLVVYNSNRTKHMETARVFKHASAWETENLVTAGMPRAKVLKKIREEAPALIFVLGAAAYYKVSPITDTPIVFSGVEDPRAELAGRDNITGVLMQIDPVRNLAELRAVQPDVKCVGMFSKNSLQLMAREVRAALAGAGVRLIEKNVDNHPGTPFSRLLDDEMKKNIDVFWMLPVFESPASDRYKSLLSASVGHFTILTYARHYLEAGAFLAVYGNAVGMGADAAGIANRVRAGEKIEHIAPAPASESVTRINLDVADAFGINVPPETLKKMLTWTERH